MAEETLPAVRAETQLDRFARLGQWLAASESGDSGPNALGAAAALRLFYADALGLSPLAAAELSVIKGRLFVQAKLLRAMAATRGYRVRRTPDSNAETCTAVLEDQSGRELGRTTFTMADATAAGLVRDRSAWQTHPARMLWARASKFVLDDYAPEITLGLGTFDEAAEIEDRPAEPEGEEPIEAEFSEEDPAEGTAGPAAKTGKPEAKKAASGSAAGVERDNEASPYATADQRRELFELKEKLGVSDARLREILKDKTGQEATAQIPADKYDQVVFALKAEGVPFA